MSHLLLLFWGAFVVGFSGAMMPGPMLTATISEVMKRGFIAGPLIVVGHGILELALLVALVFGLSAWLTRETVIGVLSVGGGLILILMGLHMAWHARTAAEKALAQQADARAALHGPVVAGILTSLSNPYWTLWWATIGLGYAAVSLERGLPGIGSFYTGHILADFAWYGAVAAAVSSGRRVCPPVVYRWILVGCGLALVGLGAWFVATGVPRLG